MVRNIPYSAGQRASGARRVSAAGENQDLARAGAGHLASASAGMHGGVLWSEFVDG